MQAAIAGRLRTCDVVNGTNSSMFSDGDSTQSVPQPTFQRVILLDVRENSSTPNVAGAVSPPEDILGSIFNARLYRAARGLRGQVRAAPRAGRPGACTRRPNSEKRALQPEPGCLGHHRKMAGLHEPGCPTPPYRHLPGQSSYRSSPTSPAAASIRLKLRSASSATWRNSVRTSTPPEALRAVPITPTACAG
jgi:hypothetical protein